MGFVGPEPDGIIAQLGVELDRFGNVKTDNNYMTSVPGVFSAGDMRRGQSLIVWAISEGREAARGVDSYLMGHSELPTKGDMDLPTGIANHLSSSALARLIAEDCLRHLS